MSARKLPEDSSLFIDNKKHKNMEFKKAASIVKDLFKVEILHQRIPITVSWALTYRCNSRCLY